MRPFPLITCVLSAFLTVGCAGNIAGRQAGLEGPSQLRPIAAAAPPCSGTPGDRSLELCATWAGVDAARDAADWAETAGYLGVLSLILTVAAVATALRSNHNARVSHERSVRAYIGIKTTEFVLSEGRFLATVHLKNFGQTPAGDVRSETVLEQHQHRPPAGTLNVVIKDTGGSRSTIHPGEFLTVEKECGVWNISELESLKEANKRQFVISAVEYKDVFEKVRTTTYACWLDPDAMIKAIKIAPVDPKAANKLLADGRGVKTANQFLSFT